MWKVFTFAVLVCVLLVGDTLARKTSKEWAAFNRKKYAEIEEQERKEMEKTFGKERQADKPGMVFATFGPDYSKDEKNLLSSKFYTQLQSAGIKVSIFESGENQWVLATFRQFDTFDVVKYLREQPEVMKVTLDTQDWWHLPKYQTEYIKEMEKKEKEAKEKEAKKKREEEEAKRKAEEETKVNEDDLDAKEL